MKTHDYNTPRWLIWPVAVLIFSAWALAVPAIHNSLIGTMIAYALITFFGVVTLGLVLGGLWHWWRSL